MAQVDEISDLKAALESCEEKWYNKGFADTENSVEPIVYQAMRHGFGEEQMAALQAIGVPDESPLRNPKQIPFSEPPPLVQNLSGADEEDSPSMRELVCEIDTYVELVDLEVTSNLNTALHSAQPAEDIQAQPFPTAQPTEEAPAQLTEDAALSQSADLIAQV